MSYQQQNNAPLDKGRVAVVVEKYPTNQVDNRGDAIMKNRYASIGRATLWPSKQGSNAPNIEIDIDTLPIGQTGQLKMYIFWDSDNQQNQQQQNQYQQAPQQQQNNQQPAPTRWPNNNQR